MAKFELQAYSSLPYSLMLRKAIHISGFAVSFMCIHLFNNYWFLLSLFLVTVFYVISELARTKGISVPLFSTITIKANASGADINHFVTAPISFAIGILLSLIVFPTQIAYVSIAVLTLGDGFASIFGRVFGRTPFFFNRKKNLEGTICGFACAFLGSMLFVGFLEVLVAAAVGMLAESLPLPLDDNLVTPLAAGTALILLTLF